MFRYGGEKETNLSAKFISGIVFRGRVYKMGSGDSTGLLSVDLTIWERKDDVLSIYLKM